MLWQYLLSTSTFCIKFCDFNDTFVADVNGQKFISNEVIVEVIHDLPIVGVIQDMYIVNGNQLIFYNDCYHTSFEPHYRAYVLDNYSFSSKLIYHSSLFIHNSVHVHTSCVLDLSPHFVILPYALCVPV